MDSQNGWQFFVGRFFLLGGGICLTLLYLLSLAKEFSPVPRSAGVHGEPDASHVYSQALGILECQGFFDVLDRLGIAGYKCSQNNPFLGRC